MKDVAVNTVVVTEIACWFFIGECIGGNFVANWICFNNDQLDLFWTIFPTHYICPGKGSLVGYQV